MKIFLPFARAAAPELARRVVPPDAGERAAHELEQPSSAAGAVHHEHREPIRPHRGGVGLLDVELERAYESPAPCRRRGGPDVQAELEGTRAVEELRRELADRDEAAAVVEAMARLT